MEKNKEKTLFKISFPGVTFLFVLLLILKFTLIPQMSWWWVFSPIWIPFAIIFLILFLTILSLLIAALLDTPRYPW